MPETDLVTTLEELKESFKAVSQYDDRLLQEYEILRQAGKLNLDPLIYLRLFEHYSQEKTPRVFHPLAMADAMLGTIVEWFRHTSLVRLAQLMGELTLLVALGSYLIEGPKRKQEAIHEARSAINENADQPFSSGRIHDLQFLNRSCEPIQGFELKSASIPHVDLSQCYKWQFNLQNLSHFPPQLRYYVGADLSNINLQGADLRGAILTGANFAYADLSEANLSGAILTGVNFTGANLSKAQLNGANLEQAHFEGSRLVEAQMTRSRLNRARFIRADLTGANLAWSSLEGAEFLNTKLIKANLTRTNLQSVSFYRANLESAALRYANLQNHASIRGSSIKNADFRFAILDPRQQLISSQDWDTIKINPNWKNAVGQPSAPLKVGLVMFPGETIFDSYVVGMKSVPGIEVLTEYFQIKAGESIAKTEAKAIQKLIDAGAETVVFRPATPVLSVPIMEMAYNYGIVVITIADCMTEDKARQYAFGCYKSPTEEIAYIATKLMVRSLEKKYPNTSLHLALLDGVNAGGLYPYFKGFSQAMDESKVPWEQIVSSSEIEKFASVPFIQNLIVPYPDLHAIWSPSFTGTLTVLEAVKNLNLEQKIPIYGILDLTPKHAEMLLDPTNPLQILVNENPVKAGRLTVERALEVLRGENLNYQQVNMPYQVFEKSDREAVKAALAAMRAFQ